MAIGRIYKIIHTQSNICYVGSTFNKIRVRFSQHKADFQKWKKGKARETSIFPYFDKHGIDQFKVILIKEYEVVDKKHLTAFEQLFINKLESVNKNNPFRIDYLHRKHWRENNREAISKSMKQYYEANREAMAEKNKQYYKDNRAKIRAMQNQKFSCGCGGRYTRMNKLNHFDTKKHKSWISTHIDK